MELVQKLKKELTSIQNKYINSQKIVAKLLQETIELQEQIISLQLEIEEKDKELNRIITTL